MLTLIRRFFIITDVVYTSALTTLTPTEAISTPDTDTWLQAMMSEMDSIKEKDTEELVEPPARRKSLPCKWFYKYKYVSGSKKTKYKAQIVAKGFKQEHDIDYDDILSPIVKMTIVRLVLGVVVTEDLELEQLDVKTTFLRGDSEEDIYISQPTRLTTMGEEARLLCRLKKSRYGLKQMPMIWY